MPKAPGTLRVFIAGESVAYNLGINTVRSVLGRHVPADRTIEVVNAGVPSYDSSMIAPVVEEILDYQPDLVVVLGGNNEVNMGEECPGLQESMAKRLMILGLPGTAGFKDYLSLFDPSFFAKRRGRLLLYEANLRRMVRVARSKGVAIVLCALPVNIADYAPWGAAPFDNPIFDEAWLCFDRGEWAKAAELFRRYTSLFPREPFSRYFLGTCLRRMGRIEEAREQYLEAVEWDPIGGRASRAKNDIVRRVAKEEGAYLAELDPLFNRVAPDGLVGFTMIFDGVHWFRRFDALVSYEILRALADSARPWRELPSFDRPRFKKEYAQAILTSRSSSSDGWFRALKTLWVACAYLDRWSMENSEGAILENGIAMLRRVDASGGKARLLLRASRAMTFCRMLPKSPWVPDLAKHFDRWFPLYLEHLGEMLRRQGESEKALPFFDEAVRLAPERHLFRFFRALARSSVGDRKGARADVDALRDRMPQGSKWSSFLFLAFPSIDSGVRSQTSRSSSARPAPSWTTN